MDYLRQVWAEAVQTWHKLTLSAKVNIALAALVTLGVVFALVAMGSHTQYAALFTRLSVEDTAAIQAELQDRGVKYVMRDSATTVMVPVQKLSQLRVDLAAKGLPKTQGTVPGFELFDRKDLMTNQYLQDLNYQRAINGELQRMLNEFDFVDSSAVFISPAKEELFSDSQKPSKAAVTLSVSRRPTEKEVRAVLNIVATHGGANLDLNHITLATTKGELLYEPPRDELTALASSKADYIQKWEALRERKVLDAFEQIGKKAIVRVSAKVDFRTVRETVNEVTKGTAVSSLSTATTTNTREAAAEGPPGATANPPEGAQALKGTITEETTEQTLENNEPSKRTTETTNNPGDVIGYSVSVLMESNYRPVLDEGGKPTGKVEPEPLTDDQKQKWRAWIAKAVGPGVDANADVIVEDQAFDVAQLAQAQATVAGVAGVTLLTMFQGYGINALKLLLVIGAFIWVRRLLQRAFRKPEEEVEEEGLVITGPQVTPEDLRNREVASEVERAFQEQPEMVVALLRSWLTESQE